MLLFCQTIRFGEIIMRKSIDYTKTKDSINSFLSKMRIKQRINSEKEDESFYQGGEDHPLALSMLSLSAAQANESESESESEGKARKQMDYRARDWILGEKFEADNSAGEDEAVVPESVYSPVFNAVLFAKLYFSLYFQNHRTLNALSLRNYNSWNPLRFIFNRNQPSLADQNASKKWVINHALDFIVCAYRRGHLFSFLNQEVNNLLFFYNTNIILNSLMLPDEFNALKDHLLVYYFTLTRHKRQVLLSNERLNKFLAQVRYYNLNSDTVSWIEQRSAQIKVSDLFFLSKLPLRYNNDVKPHFTKELFSTLVSVINVFRKYYDKFPAEFFDRSVGLGKISRMQRYKYMTPGQARAEKKARRMGLKLSREIAALLNENNLIACHSELKFSCGNERAFFKAVNLGCARESNVSDSEKDRNFQAGYTQG